MLYDPLDAIFGSINKVRVLRALVHLERPVSGRHAARLAGVSSKAITALEDLTGLGLISKAESTGQYLYSFNPHHHLAPDIVALFETEAQRSAAIVDELADHLRSIDHVVSAALFGSGARGEARAHSDLDVLVLVDRTDAKAKATDTLLDLAPAFRKQFGVRLSPFVLTDKQWKQRMRDGDALAVAAAQEAKTFIGVPIASIAL